MTRIGGVIGAVLGFLLPFVLSGGIDVVADNTAWSDTVATAIGVAFAVGGWFVGTRITQRLRERLGRGDARLTPPRTNR